MESSYQGGVAYENNGGSNYQRLSQTIASNVKKISQNVSSMSKMVNQLLTPQDTQELRNQLRQIQNYTQKLVKDTSTLIIELRTLPIDQPAQKLARDRLSDEYMITLNSFQTTQRLAAHKSKEEMKNQKMHSATIGDPFAMSSQSGNNELVEIGDSSVRKQEQLTMQTERSILELEERENDIRSLENDIMDVNQIFKELGTMIHAQGEVVDSIESSVEHTTQNVENGAVQLREAANYKNKLRKKKVYLFLALIVIVSIILIVVFHN